MNIRKSSLIIPLLIFLIITIISRTEFKTSSSRENLTTQKSLFATTPPQTIINVSDYPGESDYQKIQSALNDVPPEGAIVFIPKGTWTASGLRAFNNTFILGTNETIISRPENTTTPFLTFENATNFSVKNLIFDGKNETEAIGIRIINSSNFEIVNCTFININRRAISVLVYSTNFKIEGNRFINCHEATILLFGTPGQRIITNFEIKSNTLMYGTDNGKIGIAFSSNGTVENNTLVGNEYGIGTRGISNITITNNRILNSSSFGIYLGTQIADFGTVNITITNNQIINTQIGIARYYGSQPVSDIKITNNLFIENREWDIYADFQAAFFNNTITTKEKIKTLTIPTAFSNNVDINGTPIILADVNLDGKVDMHDIGSIARRFGATEESETWDPKLDIIQDGKIDMRDLGYTSQNFGIQN